MSARKLAALVIKLVLFYLATTYIFNASMYVAFLQVDEAAPFPYFFVQIVVLVAFSFIFFGGLHYADHLARWIVREDWTIVSEADDGSVFWSRTVPILMVMGTGIIILGRSASGAVSALVEFIAEYHQQNPDPTEFKRIFVPTTMTLKHLIGSLFSLALGAYLFLRPGGLLRLFHRFGKMG